MLESAALSFAKKYAQHTRDSWLVEAKKEDPKAKVRNRPECIFDNTSKLVKDNKDHFPIDTLARAKNALAQVNKYDEVPEWFNGDLKKLMKMVVSAVKAKYPEINVDVKKDTSIKESVYLNEEEEEQEDEGKDEGDSGEGEESGEDMDSDNSSDSDSEEDEMTVETAVAMLKDAFDADELEELKKLLSSEEGEKAEETETEEVNGSALREFLDPAVINQGMDLGIGMRIGSLMFMLAQIAIWIVTAVVVTFGVASINSIKAFIKNGKMLASLKLSKCTDEELVKLNGYIDKIKNNPHNKVTDASQKQINSLLNDIIAAASAGNGKKILDVIETVEKFKMTDWNRGKEGDLDLRSSRSIEHIRQGLTAESVDPELKNIKATDPRFADVLNRINAKTRAGKTSKIADINDEMNSETEEEDEE